MSNPAIYWEEDQRSPTMRTSTGKYVDLIDPQPCTIDIVDIAHSLANQCRWTGHTREFYSVAQHSLLVSRLCDPNFRLLGLLHDATEAYTCDISSPLKAVIGGEAGKFKRVQTRLSKVIFEKFSLSFADYPKIKVADMEAAAIESEQLMGKLIEGLQVPERFKGFVLTPMPPTLAKSEFLMTFAELREY